MLFFECHVFYCIDWGVELDNEHVSGIFWIVINCGIFEI